MSSPPLGPRSAPSTTFFLLIIISTMIVIATGVQMLAPLLLVLANEFSSSVAVMGQLVAAGGIAWGMSGPVFGALSDRYGRKPLLVLGLVSFGALTVLCSWVGDLPTLFALRVLACVGGSCAATNVQASVADYFPAERRARALGWTVTAFSLAAMIGAPTIALIADLAGWRWSIRIEGFAVLAMAAVAYLAFPPLRPQGSGSYGATFRTLLRSRAVTGLLACNVFERVTYNAIATYLAAFLMQSYGLTVGQVAPVISAVALATLAGTMVGGRVAGWANPVIVFTVAQTAAALAAPALMLPMAAVWLSGLLAAAFTAINATSRPSYMLMVTQVAPPVRGAMMGLNVTTNQAGLVLGSALGGVVIGFGGYAELGLVSCATGLIAALSCRFLVRAEHLTKVGASQPATPPTATPSGI